MRNRTNWGDLLTNLCRPTRTVNDLSNTMSSEQSEENVAEDKSEH